MDSNLKTAHGRNYIRLLGFLAVLSVFLALPGCGSIATEYVAADRLTYNAIAPEYRRYVEADPTLHDENGDLTDSGKLKIANLDSWNYRLDEAEKAGK